MRSACGPATMELAGALGLQRTKTVREWFPAPNAQKEADKSADLSSRRIPGGNFQFEKEFCQALRGEICRGHRSRC